MNKIMYVPILKWKQGEQGAMKALDNEVKKHFIPFIELPAREYDFKEKKFKKTIEQHIEKVPKSIVKSWQNYFYFDICNLNTEILSDGTYIYEYFDKNFDNSTNNNCIPVYTPTLNQNINYFCNCIKKDRLLAIRLKFNKIKSLSEYLDIIIKNLHIDKENMANIDLIIDLEYIKENEEEKILKLLQSELNSITSLHHWRFITLAGTSFPESLSNVEKNSYCTIPRTFFILYKNFLRTNKFDRNFLFGDYGISNPKTADNIDPRLLSPACSIRYTMKSKYFVVKGKSFKKYGGEQFRNLCEAIIIRPRVFFGRNFSLGDAYIEDCANGLAKAGNMPTWRRIGTIHHITLLVKQLSNSLDI